MIVTPTKLVRVLCVCREYLVASTAHEWGEAERRVTAADQRNVQLTRQRGSIGVGFGLHCGRHFAHAGPPTYDDVRHTEIKKTNVLTWTGFMYYMYYMYRADLPLRK